MNHFCFIFCVLLIATYAGLSESTRQNTNSYAKDGGNELEGYLDGGRTKRGVGIGGRFIALGAAMVKGLRARQKLLKDLTPVKRYKSVTYYNKNGDVTKMIGDFDAVNPTNVGPFKLSGKTAGMQGKVGDRVISYDTGSPIRPRRITLSKTKRNGEVIVDIITYGKFKTKLR